MKPATKLANPIATVLGVLATLLVVAVQPGWTQLHGGGASFHPAGGRPTAHATAHVATPLNPNFAPLHGVPGLGFDYEHLAAVSRPSRGNRAGRGRSGRTFLTPIFDYGFPYYYTFDTGEPYDSSPNLQASPVAMVPPIPDASEFPADASVAASASAPAAPVPELGQLILVRRDGQVLLAVAFSTSGGRLTYITQDGLRRSFPVAELDGDATRQMNDVNGTTVALPK